MLLLPLPKAKAKACCRGCLCVYWARRCSALSQARGRRGAQMSAEEVVKYRGALREEGKSDKWVPEETARFLSGAHVAANELWLFRVPIDFDPDCLDGQSLNPEVAMTVPGLNGGAFLVGEESGGAGSALQVRCLRASGRRGNGLLADTRVARALTVTRLPEEEASEDEQQISESDAARERLRRVEDTVSRLKRERRPQVPFTTVFSHLGTPKLTPKFTGGAPRRKNDGSAFLLASARKRRSREEKQAKKERKKSRGGDL